MTARPLIYFAMVVSSLIAPLARSGQCEDWKKGPFVDQPEGLDGSVHASTLWDPDGPEGPSEALLVVGGNFTTAGGESANYVAIWDGGKWKRLDNGTNGTVYALTSFNGDLIAGGAFTIAGTIPGPQVVNHVARWGGTAWHPMSTGMNGSVLSLAVYDGELYAGGSFTSASGVTANRVAKWNQGAWHAVDSGIAGGFAPSVNAMCVHNNELIAAGQFLTAGGVSASRVARWNGDSWASMGTGFNSTCDALAVHFGALYAGGRFDKAGTVDVDYIARWNGSAWTAATAAGGMNDWVFSLASHGGLLVAGGRFTTAGTTSAYRIARGSDCCWFPMSGGISGTTSPSVLALTAYGDALIAGGSFTAAGAGAAHHIAQWSQATATWSAVDAPFPFVYAINNYTSDLVVAGDFIQSTAVAVPANRIGRWDGAQFWPFGSGMNGPIRAVKGFTQSTPPFGFELVAGGSFTTASGGWASGIARWVDAAVFPPVVPTWQPMGDGFGGTVWAIERFNGSTYAGGEFIHSGQLEAGGAAGLVTVNHIARWNEPTDTWLPVGSSPVGVNGNVYALRAGASIPFLELLVGGDFTSAGSVGAKRIARWQVNPAVPGSGTWGAMGVGFNDGAVYAIERHNNNTYVGGSFTTSGTTQVNRVAHWTGSVWEPVGSGFNGTVRALKSSGGFLYAAGDFTTADGLSADRVARWDGTKWDEVHGGADETVFAMGSFHDELHAGGEFLTVRNGSIESPAWAKYHETGVVWIVEQPDSAAQPCGANFAPNVQPATGYGGLSYQWRKDSVPLVSGPTGTGSTIVGATGNFAILDVSEADEGDYDCVITNGCGSVTSQIATLTVIGDCPGCTGFTDLNCDGEVDGFDLALLLGQWTGAATYSPCPPAIQADFNGDCKINGIDLALLLGAWG